MAEIVIKLDGDDDEKVYAIQQGIEELLRAYAGLDNPDAVLSYVEVIADKMRREILEITDSGERLQ